MQSKEEHQREGCTITSLSSDRKFYGQSLQENKANHILQMGELLSWKLTKNLKRRTI